MMILLLFIIMIYMMIMMMILLLFIIMIYIMIMMMILLLFMIMITLALGKKLGEDEGSMLKLGVILPQVSSNNILSNIIHTYFTKFCKIIFLLQNKFNRWTSFKQKILSAIVIFFHLLKAIGHNYFCKNLLPFSSHYFYPLITTLSFTSQKKGRNNDEKG